MSKIKKAECWVVIPAYNEQGHVSKVIKDVMELKYNVVAIDDGSTDETFEQLCKHDIFALRHLVNLGKGVATRTGIEFAIQQGAKYIVLMDSDGQHKAKDLPRLFKKLEKNDIVFGNRKINGRMPMRFRIGNLGLSLLVWILFGIKIRDTQSGFRAFRAGKYEDIKWDSSRYSMETEMITKVSKHGLKYDCITIDTIYIDRNKGTTVFDGLKIFYDMLCWRLAKK
jgi:glycosyltransferase involved in cell wall biosynthesis